MNAINSVLAQTYQNWELIIWNDGSTDDTEKVLAALSDSRIKRYGDENHGKSYVLNQCLGLAQGELVAFLDDDDIWLPHKLETQTEAMLSFPEIDMVFGNFRNINLVDRTEGLGFDMSHQGFSKLFSKKVDESFWLVQQGFLRGIGRDNFIAFDSVLIRKKMINHLGLFNEKLKCAEDFEYWWRFGLSEGQAGFTERILINRYKHANSLSGRSLLASNNYIDALDSCVEHSHLLDRVETITYLKPAYMNAWQNKIKLFGTLGEKGNAWHAFIKSLKYGFSPGSVKLILRSLISSKKINIY
jgi:glycosyltransferase involved in cell wall biosynthesis